MDRAPSDDQDLDDQDRVVSRRVDHPTGAEPGDEAAYQAADPVPDDGTGDSAARAEPDAAGTAEDAASEVNEAPDSEPDRSE